MLRFVLLLCSAICGILTAPVHIYVSPSGSDSHSGLSVSQPLKSIHKARDKLDENGIKGNEVYIELMKGYHDLPSTLVFHHGYSAPVTVRSYQHQEVHVTGGRRIKSNLFKPVTDSSILKRIPSVAHAKVRQIHLPDVGITDYGKLSKYGFYTQRLAPLEVFINGDPLRLAEWPNNNYINIESVVDGRYGKTFKHGSSRDSHWAAEKEPWVYGYWYFSWADHAAKVASIDSHAHTITLTAKTTYGLRNGSLRTDGQLNGNAIQGGYFRVINMLSELDQPGEYYLDRSSGILYLWPNTPTGTLQDSDIIYVSLIDACISFPRGHNNLNFEDFTLEACRSFGFSGHNANHMKFTNLEIKNTGTYGIRCDHDCRAITVSKCDIHHTDGGIQLNGGDLKQLVSSGNIIEDNHIWKFGRATMAGANGISPTGVNIIMRNNYLHDGPYSCVRWAGNDHIMEYNHLSRCCYNSSDCGGLHAGRDWTMRGNIIRYNYIDHTLRYWPGSDVRGIMLDDQYSSVTIEHNVFYNNEIHANIGGGRDNIIRYNIFYDATSASIQFDGRGINKGYETVMETRLKNIPYTNSLWSSRYPKLAAMAISNTRNYPEGNQIYRNVFYNKKGINRITFYSNVNHDKYYHQYDNKNSLSTTDFYSPEYNNYQLECTAKEWANTVNFQQPVSLDKVGPRYPYGPRYLNKGKLPTKKHVPAGFSKKPCAGTVAPATDIPRGSYLPDGSRPNNLVHNITKTGCWLLINSCPAHPSVKGTFRDNYGEQHEEAGTSEAKCLARAAKEWVYCGSVKDNTVTAVYGPTGAMTIGGDGCFFADYGCPKHNDNRVGFYRDSWAEQNENAANDEEACLKRAAEQWSYCGRDRNKPYTSIYRPTGAVRTGGAGCWIKVAKCQSDPNVKNYFYDSWGASNLGTDDDESECQNRAGYYWRKCGSHDNYPVTAYYRPTGRGKTIPSK